MTVQNAEEKWKKHTDSQKDFKDWYAPDVISRNMSTDISPRFMAEEAMNYVHAILAGEEKGLSFGWGEAVDDCTMGLEKENLIIFGGENKAGKTTFAVNTAMSALKEGKRVQVVTTEISGKMYLLRLASNVLKISLRDIRTKDALSKEQVTSLIKFLERIKKAPLQITDRPHCTIDMIEDAAYDAQPDVLIIDHLQRIDPQSENIAIAYKNVSQRLKQLAVDMGIPVLTLSQVTLADGWYEYKDGEFHYTLRNMNTRWSREPIGEGDKILFLHNLERDMPSMAGRANVIYHSLRDYESGGYSPVRLNYNHQWVGSEKEYYERYGISEGPR